MLFETLLERAREKSWGFLLLVIAVSIGMSLLINLVFFRYNTFGPVYGATYGLLNGTLIASALHLLVIVGLLVLVGRMRGPEFGVVARHISPGVFTLALLWAALNLVLLVAALLAGQGVVWHPRWANMGVLAGVGSLIGQVFGNALAEEVLYRGFLLPQFWHKLRALAGRPWLRVALAVLIMGAVFSVSHIPNRMYHGQPFNDWAFLIGMGALFAVIYLRTGNLFVAVAVHALHNAPALLFDSPLDYGIVIVALDVLLVILWPQIAGLYGWLYGRAAD